MGVILTTGGGGAQAQESVPATTSGPATTRAEDPAAGLENKLQRELVLDLHATPLDDVIEKLRKSTATNIVVKWAALEKAGVSRKLPVTFRATHIGYEQTLRILLEGLSTEQGRLNFAASTDGGGLIEISTVEDFGKKPRADIYEMRRLLDLKFEGGGGEDRIGALTKILENELAAWGEPAGTWKFGIEPTRGRLVLSGSDRAHAIVRQTAFLLVNAVRPPLVPKQVVLPLRGAKAAEALGVKISGELKEHTLDEVAAYLADVGKVNIVISPAAVDPAAKFAGFTFENQTVAKVLTDVLAAAGKGLAWEISASGVIVIGREEQLALHDVTLTYDVRELLTRAAKGKSVGEVAEKLVAAVKERIGSVKGRDAAMYQGVLMVRASAGQHRELAGALVGMVK